MKRAGSFPRLEAVASYSTGASGRDHDLRRRLERQAVLGSPPYLRDPVEELAQSGAEVLLSINASPYHMGKRELRREIVRARGAAIQHPRRLRESGRRERPACFRRQQFCHGRATGKVIASAASFAEDLVLVDIDAGTGDHARESAGRMRGRVRSAGARARAITSASADFRKVLIGLSGGIDSSLDRRDRCRCCGQRRTSPASACPGRFRPDHSVTDAREMARESGHPVRDGPDHADVRPVSRSAGACVRGRQPDVTEENLQSRLRGVTLMALSNKTGALVLTTGNKSELAVGYCTLVWRYVRRTGRHQRCSEDTGLPAFARREQTAQRTPFRRTCSSSRLPRNCGPTRRTPIRFPNTIVLDRILKGTWKRRRAASENRRGTGRRCRAGARHHQQSRPQRIQAAAGRARPEGHNQSVRDRAALPHRAKIHGMK